ncbi:MAG TPA: pectate lyase [Tepidisphaeraceae bacterium]|nr:pectate lyase [Tepidisphaeraceae bacterium]
MRCQFVLAFICLLGLHANLPAAGTSANKHFGKPAEWFGSDEAKLIAANILSHQSPRGGWPSNTDTAAKLYDGDPAKLGSTFDNSATTDELRYLARMHVATGQQQYADAFERGLRYILEARLPSGGWPQQYPHRGDYSQYITYNDGTTVRLMFFCREVARDDSLYQFVPTADRAAAMQAWDKGIEVILKTQIRVDGKLTAWCAQHDQNDFTPKSARTFEPVSTSGCETIGIVHALMAIEAPSREVVRAVDAAHAWLDSVKIVGIRVEDRPQEGTPRGYDRFVVADPTAPPMWARFYEIGSNKPIFGDRDGKVYYDLADISIERRTGYQWLKYWPKKFVDTEYPEWKAKLAVQPE